MAVRKKDKDNDKLKKIKQSIEDSYNYFRHNYKRFHEDYEFLGVSSLNDAEKDLLEDREMPVLEFNSLEPYVSRQIGEFCKHEPSISVERDANCPPQEAPPATIAVVEGNFRAILDEANKYGFANSIIKDMFYGGFSVAKVITEYANEMAIEQVMRYRRVYDPTLCYFDKNSVLKTKADARFCGEIFPKTADEVKSLYGNKINLDDIEFVRSPAVGSFNWSYESDDEDIMLLCHHYEIQYEEKEIVKLLTGETMTLEDYETFKANWNAQGNIAQAPGIIGGKSRITKIPCVYRYTLIENQILNEEKTDFKSLPLVFFDGNSITYRKNGEGAAKQVTRSYIWNAKGFQRLNNFAGQKIADEMQDNDAKYIINTETLNEKYLDGITNNKKVNAIITNGFTMDAKGEKIPCNPVQETARRPVAPELMNFFMSAAQVTQTILGSYDAALGINDNQLSGVAVVESATQSNAVGMPYIMGYLDGLTQLGVIGIDLMPKIYKLPQTLPIMRPDGKRSFVPINQSGGISMDYSSNALHISVKAGVNFAIQKSRALNQIISLCQASPLFAQFINEMGLEILLDNLEIRGIDQLKEMAQQFMQQLKQQKAMAMQNNPQIMKEKNAQQLIQLKGQELSLKQQQAQSDEQLRTAEIMNDANANTNDRLKIMIQQQSLGMQDAVEMQKAKAEEYNDAVELALKSDAQQHKHTLEIHDQLHQHAKDTVGLMHDAIGLSHQIKQDNKPQPTGANQNG